VTALTKTKQRVLRAAAVLTESNGYAPTSREIGDVLEMASTNAVAGHLVDLRGEGMVDWADGKSRTLHLTSKGWDEVVGKSLSKKRSNISESLLGRLDYLTDR